ncbi:MAG TPA: TetR/AcrR family transcriptional regulator, partial [Bacillales bacterium]|nr:TetR/AcrR family transcriptional regulator [Bacillales bacterium]
VAKGSVYNHFDSKENLLLSIFKFYYDLLIEKVSRVSEDDSLSARERLVRQIHLQFQEFLRHRNFIEMQMREQALQVNEEITAFMFQIRADTLEWYRNEVVEVYGDEVRRYAYDLGTLLNAMISEYIGYLIIDKMNLDLGGLSEFIVDRLDDLAAGLAERQPEPMVTEGIVAARCGSGAASASAVAEVLGELEGLRKLAEEMGDPLREEVLEALALLEAEVDSDEPRKVVVKGMLAFLQDVEHAGVRGHAERIAALLPL